MRITTGVGMVGAYFVAWQLWTFMKARNNASAYEAAEGRSKADFVSLSQYQKELGAANGAPKRLLNVNNFSLAELEGKKAPRNDLS